jgi:hypothetical protein
LKKRQEKIVRRVQAAMWVAVIVVQVCTVARIRVPAAGLEAEGAGEALADFPESGQFPQEDGTLVVKSLPVLAEEELVRPQKHREGPGGRDFLLARWETVPVVFPGHREEISRTEEYEQVEDETGIPRTMEVLAEWEDQSVTVVCEKQDQKRTGEAWVDGFRLPVTFHGYRADYYELGDLKIPHDDTRPRLEGQEAVLLEMAGLSPVNRRIETIAWDGPAYTADDGEVRRDALAAGQSRIADYQVTYAGTAVFPERPGWQTVAVYEPVEAEVIVEESTAPTPPEAVIPDTPVPLWQKLTRTLLVSVGIGSILAVAGLVIFGILYLVKRRKI